MNEDQKKLLFRINGVIFSLILIIGISVVVYDYISGRRNLYKKEVIGVVKEINEETRGPTLFLINRQWEYFESFGRGTIKCNVGDSIVKESMEKKIVIYRKYAGKYKKLKEINF